MNLPKQLINLLGVVVTVAVLVAGIALGALPLWGQSQTTEATVRSIAANNDIYDTQVQALTAATADLATIEASVAELRGEIPRRPALSDVHEIVDRAAGAAQGAVISVKPGEAAAFGTPADGTEAAPEATPDAAETETEATPEPEVTETPAPVEEESPRRQVPVDIEVLVADPAAATAFLTNLAAGPRLINVQKITVDGLEAGGMTLKIQALTFLRSE